MHRRRRRGVTAVLLLTAAGVLAAWLVVDQVTANEDVAGAAVPAPPPLTASVTGDGRAVGVPVGWQSRRIDQGRYRLTFDRDTRLGIATWDTTATVIVRPLVGHSWQVDFVEDHRAVDTSFSFIAASP